MPKKKNAGLSRRESEKTTAIEQARKQQILEAASALFRNQGFAKTSLDDIARSVGVSRGILFYYFDGKREIGINTLRLALREYSAFVRERMEGKRKPSTRLLAFIDACLDYQQFHPELYLDYVELIACLDQDSDRYTLTELVNKRTRQLLMQLIRDGQAAGDIARVSPQGLADVIQAFIDGTMEMAALEPGVVDFAASKRLIRQMVKHVIDP